MEALLDPIFACELTAELTQALGNMAYYIPPVKSRIQERLLSNVLFGGPFKPLPGPPRIVTTPVSAKDLKDPLAFEHHQTEIRLALNTLGVLTSAAMY
jgi:serine/threonine-protein kinase mTOR